MKKSICSIIAVIMLVSGCVTSPGRQYQAAALSFSQTVETLADFRQAGKFTDEQEAKITIAVHAGKAVLQEWAYALKDGKSYPSGPLAVSAIVAELQGYVAMIDEGVSQ